MAKGKIDINKNFENLKAQMMRKKEIAEAREESEPVKENESQLKNITPSNIASYEVATSKDENSITLEETVNVPDFINDNIDPQKTIKQGNNVEYTARKTGMVSDININKIIIKKVEKQEQPKRITYYLKPETIKKIDKFSKLSGMGKSEFVQKILDEVLNNLEIER